MAIYDNFGKRISVFGRDMKRKQEDISSTVRLNNAIKSLETDLTASYERLGRAYYNFRKNGIGSDAETESLVAQISQTEREREALLKETQQIRGVMVCPQCHSEVITGSRFCNSCGFQFPEVVRNKPSGFAGTCPNCGSAIEEGQLFCMECGTKIEKPPISEVSQEAEPEPEWTICPACKSTVKKGQRFCDNCGFDLTQKEDASADRFEETDRFREEIRCLQCGALLEEGQVFCVECGARIAIEDGKASDASDIENGDSGHSFCTACGARLDTGQAFCTECGAPVQPFEEIADIPEAEQKESLSGVERATELSDPGKEEYDIALPNILGKGSIINEESEMAAPAATAGAEAISASDNRFCPECGNELIPGARFCVNCGTPVE